jgi:hypothetical protein
MRMQIYEHIYDLSLLLPHTHTKCSIIYTFHVLFTRLLKMENEISQIKKNKKKRRKRFENLIHLACTRPETSLRVKLCEIRSARKSLPTFQFLNRSRTQSRWKGKFFIFAYFCMQKCSTMADSNFTEQGIEANISAENLSLIYSHSSE